MFWRKHSQCSHGNDSLQRDAKVKELRVVLGSLSSTSSHYCTDSCLTRYLEARNWNVDKANKMLEETLKWRALYKPQEIRWNEVAHEGETGKVSRASFHDRLGRSVLILRPGKQNTASADGNIRHLVYMIENAILNLPEGQEQMSWLIDFTGWSLSNSVPIKTARESISILQNHYPERLGLAFLYNPPRIFETFWKVIRYFLDPKTIEKVKFIHPNKRESVELMRSHFAVNNLPGEFGGNANLDYDHEEFSRLVARSHQGAVAAIENRQKRFYGLQYHPEVTHSPQGMETLRYFLFDICGVHAEWKMEDVMNEELKTIQTTVGPDDHVICALSGGVDSAVAATLVHKAIGDRLHCVFVDNGLLRYKEQEHVMDMFEKDLHLPGTCVDASEKFLRELKGVKDPEKKRKIIGKEFINIFDGFAHDLERKVGRKPLYLVQGTVYPDVIESCPPPGSGMTHSHTIKSHHNVGGLPKDMKLKLIEPLKLLFKDEVRAMGKILNVPEGFLKRHPFPGPGLAVRIPGDVTKGNDLDLLRQADEIFIQSIKDVGLYDVIWQAFVVLLPFKTVGVQGDHRTYGSVVALRAGTGQDGMTADW